MPINGIFNQIPVNKHLYFGFYSLTNVMKFHGMGGNFSNTHDGPKTGQALLSAFNTASIRYYGFSSGLSKAWAYKAKFSMILIESHIFFNVKQL